VDLPTVSAAVQAVSAVAIVCLTVWLSKTARTALKTSQVQAQAADKTVAEMRKDRHLASVPMLAITPQPLVSPERNRILRVAKVRQRELDSSAQCSSSALRGSGPRLPPTYDDRGERGCDYCDRPWRE